jgi:Ca2+-binding EF-hand superfamily protein
LTCTIRTALVRAEARACTHACVHARTHAGAIDREELVEAMSATGFDEDAIGRLCVEHDKNQDGLIQFEEFVEMMRESYL